MAVKYVAPPGVGIQDVLDLRETLELPVARGLPVTEVNVPGLERLYGGRSLDGAVIAMLCPDVGAGDILQPENFTAALESCIRCFRQSDSPALAALVKDILYPLSRNNALLRACRGMMLDG